MDKKLKILLVIIFVGIILFVGDGIYNGYKDKKDIENDLSPIEKAKYTSTLKYKDNEYFYFEVRVTKNDEIDSVSAFLGTEDGYYFKDSEYELIQSDLTKFGDFVYENQRMPNEDEIELLVVPYEDILNLYNDANIPKGLKKYDKSNYY